MSLGYSLVSGSDSVLQSNLAGGANPSGAHFVNPFPQFSSIEGATSGCGGGGSNPAYNVMKGGGTMRRFKRSRSHYCRCRGVKCKCKSRRGSRRGSKRRCMCKGRCHCAKSKRSSRGGRSRRGGSSAAPLSAAPFTGGANAPYQQYMGGTPNSPVFSVGGSIVNSAMANPPPIQTSNACSAV
jgi:hypothetical protein